MDHIRLQRRGLPAIAGMANSIWRCITGMLRTVVWEKPELFEAKLRNGIDLSYLPQKSERKNKGIWALDGQR